MSFRLTGLSSEQFVQYFGKSDAELDAVGITRLSAEEGSSCRVTLEDALPGENILLLTYEHVPGPSPYRSAGPIFIREGVHPKADLVGRMPEQMLSRRYSIRAYDERNWIIASDVGVGSDLPALFERFFENDSVRYLHLHHAGHGCFAARVDRV